MRKFGVSLIIAFALAALAAGAESLPSFEHFISSGFPDNSDVRARLFSTVIGAPRDMALAYGEKVFNSSAGKVLVRTVKRSGDFVVEFLNSSEGSYTESAQGSCIIQRSNDNGFLLQARIQLQDDGSTYARLYPSGNGTRLDIVVYGAVLKKGLQVPGMLYIILTHPFADIVDATRRAFDWETVFRLGARSPAADFASDLRAAAPRPSHLAALPDKMAGFDATMSQLLSDGETAQELPALSQVPAGYADERAAIGLKSTYASFPPYAPGSGIPAFALRGALYLDALQSPNSVYLLVGEGLRGLAAPSFDEGGRLRIAFFSSGRETSWADFVGQKRDTKLRVIRISARQD